MQNKYQPDPTTHYSDIDEDNFMFPKLGKCIIKTDEIWENHRRDDIIKFDESIHNEELEKNFVIGDGVSLDTKERIYQIVKKHWDSFCSEGARRPILGYEFAINTGSHTPVCKSI
jgi:hypothetical protein